MNEKYKGLREITAWEATPLVALGAIVIVLGFYPAPVLDVIKGSLSDLVAFVSQAAPVGLAAAGL